MKKLWKVLTFLSQCVMNALYALTILFLLTCGPIGWLILLIAAGVSEIEKLFRKINLIEERTRYLDKINRAP